MPRRRTPTRATPVEPGCRSQRQSVNRANQRGGTAYHNFQQDSGSSQATSSQSTEVSLPGTSNGETVSMDQFLSLQHSVTEMRSLLQDIQVSITSNAPHDPDPSQMLSDTLNQSTAPQVPSRQVSSQASQVSSSLEHTIESHVNNLVQGNNLSLDQSFSPQGQYIKLDRPLDGRINDKLKDKIWSGQFIELHSLLDT